MVSLALSACHQIFDLEEVSPITDAALASERPAFCASAAIFDAFDGTIPCAFGAANERDALDQHDGILDITIDGTQPIFGGCSAFVPLPFTDNGAFTRVTRPLETDHAYTVFKVRNTAGIGPALDALILYTPGNLQFVVNGMQWGTRADFLPWWRIRQPSGTAVVAAELSADGITWQPFGSVSVALPATIALDIGAGINAVPAMAATATFSVLGVCD